MADQNLTSKQACIEVSTQASPNIEKVLRRLMFELKFKIWAV